MGSSGARIVRVTPERIEYLDMAGQDQVIDLKECARNWVQWSKEQGGDLVPASGASQEEIDTWNARCVGQRGGSYHQWVEFMNDRKTRFEFETWEARVKELQVCPSIRAIAYAHFPTLTFQGEGGTTRSKSSSLSLA